MKDFSSYNISELMRASTDELQELSFEGNSPDLLITVVGGRINKKEE